MSKPASKRKPDPMSSLCRMVVNTDYGDLSGRRRIVMAGGKTVCFVRQGQGGAWLVYVKAKNRRQID